MAADTVEFFRGEEVTVRVTLKERNTAGVLVDPDISGTSGLKFKILPNLAEGTVPTIEKTGGDITVVTDGTGGEEAVIDVVLDELDTDLDPQAAQYWQVFTQKGGVTRPYEPGNVVVKASGDY